MADGTRLRGIDDNLKALQDSHKHLQDSQHQISLDHKELRADINLIATSLEDQKKTMNKLLVQVGRLSEIYTLEWWIYSRLSLNGKSNHL
ncbi:hypothetical protein E3N88_18338 [Mikania micrantha]|uniref:Uncharacterized protein n=1 Tax=Mikania micrantha TaxID=192012 RepID=A0A5N6NUD1_9ASTR|nr:hypothetical protein E3N88_18338 [Mikania micrantha]